MVTGGIVEYLPHTQQYALPAEHSALLTRNAPGDNIAVLAQYISVLGGVEDRIVECFRHGGGVPYSEYDRFHEVMAEDSGQSVGSALLDSILPLVPGLCEKLERGIDVLDVGCGSGKALNLLARTFPASRFVGYDLCEDPIATARASACCDGSTNVSFEVRDLSTALASDQYDLITAFDAVHDQARPDNVLRWIADSLRDDGTFLMQDIDASSHVENNIGHPIGPLIYTISCMHCMTVSLAQDGFGLGAAWGIEKALEMLEEAGFADVEVKRLPHDIQNAYYIARKR
jgi:SAM-dependent methyltransferase